jgi:hypothetical protein
MQTPDASHFDVAVRDMLRMFGAAVYRGKLESPDQASELIRMFGVDWSSLMREARPQRSTLESELWNEHTRHRLVDRWMAEHLPNAITDIPSP